MKKIIVPIFILLVLILFVMMNIELSNISKNSFTTVYHFYIDNPVISSIYRIAILIDIILFFLFLVYIISVLKGKNQLNEILFYSINIICVISVFLIWFELYFGSTFYYGEVRDKQGLFLLTNNLGIIGSILYTNLILYFILERSKKIKLKKVIFLVLSIIIILLQILIFKALETPWNLWQS